MPSETLRPDGESSPDAVAAEEPTGTLPVISRCSLLVVSADSAQRDALVVELGANPTVEVNSASGFHMAVPLIWAAAPDAIVIGTTHAVDLHRLSELRHHAPHAVLVMLDPPPDAAGVHPDVSVSPGENLVAVLAELFPPSAGFRSPE